MEAECWLLGGEFEDSVFEEGRERRAAAPASHGAKRCEPQWFYEEAESGDDVEALTLKKFRGDLAYRRQDYQRALREYSSISEELSQTNFAMKRDAQEGQARCLAHLGRHVEALKVATSLERQASNTDHLTTVLHLQLALCSRRQHWEGTVLCLQKLISLHPFNPWNWSRLAEAYLSLGPAQKGDSLTASDKAPESSTPPVGEDWCLCSPETSPRNRQLSVEARGGSSPLAQEGLAHPQPCWSAGRATMLEETRLKVCAALTRARLLLQLTQSQQTSFALERNLETQRAIEDQLKRLSFKEDALLLIAEAMGEDLVPEKIRDELHAEVRCVGSEALAALVIPTSEEFEDRWFKRIKDHFCLPSVSSIQR
ncbi:uncharacterized protein C8orf76 homolog [Tenrec ecaudatus]|uniref:uncharacterized protein C8orf76 homolog n=1 Tax=Tenrec ecaudatus TaxID=94439 RepID=UPI003F59A052